MSDAYSIYPITLAHPAFTPSKPVPIPGTQIYDAQGKIARQDYQGTPLRFPPVTARDENEEEYYKAQGYERAGQIDPTAWVQAHSDTPPSDYKPQKYPLWRNGQLIMTAQEDPGATTEDLAPEPQVAPTPEPVVQPNEAANLRAQMDEMNRTMQAMADRIRTAEAEAAALKAEKAAAPDQLQTGPRQKRPYTRKAA